MKSKKAIEKADFIKNYIEKAGYSATWERYKSNISFGDEVQNQVFFFNPIENIKKELEEFEILIKKAEIEYMAKV